MLETVGIKGLSGLNRLREALVGIVIGIGLLPIALLWVALGRVALLWVSLLAVARGLLIWGLLLVLRLGVLGLLGVLPIRLRVLPILRIWRVLARGGAGLVARPVGDGRRLLRDRRHTGKSKTEECKGHQCRASARETGKCGRIRDCGFAWR